MKGRIASPRLLLLAALALPGLAPAQDAAPDAVREGGEAIVAVRTFAGTLNVPSPVPQTRHEIGREMRRTSPGSFVAREDVLLGAPVVQSLRFSVEVASAETGEDPGLAERIVASPQDMPGAPGVDEVRPVQVAGRPFRLIRSGVQARATSEGAGAGRENAEALGFRRLVLVGPLPPMAVKLTLVFPPSTAEDERALVEALLAFEFDVASLQQQRGVFALDAAHAVGGDRISTLLGDLPRSPEMSAFLDRTMEVRTGDGSIVSRSQTVRIQQSIDGVTLHLQCDLEAAGTPEEHVQWLHREARFNEDGPITSGIGATPGLQWHGELPGDGDPSFLTRVADRAGVRNVATLTYDGSHLLVERLAIWLDDAALPGCVPDAWAEGVPSDG